MEITEFNFEAEVINSDKPVVLDCYTEWCAPCKVLKPILTQIVEKTEGKVRLGFLDIEHNPRLAEQLRVTSVPKVLIFKDGEEVAEMLGLRSSKEYQETIEAMI